MASKASRHRTIALKRIPEMRPFLDEVVSRVEVPAYIDKDPVLFLHAYDGLIDKQLAGFFAAIMAWGRRDIVIAKVGELMERMGHKPAAFIGSYSEADREALAGFKHRTFTEEDVHHLIFNLRQVLDDFGNFEAFWKSVRQQALEQKRELIATFHERFMAYHTGPQRTRKHIASSEKGSSCKRLYLYLRWTVRQNSVVDTGIYSFMPASELMIPLDVHVARHARRLGLLGRKQNDWQAVTELTRKLRLLDPEDPAKYDYALFGLGIEDIEVPKEFVINKRIS
ncbi:MAG: TIGR02757 family protein [Candidatus Cyclonatronum sp.]|uniref:TIGR02757 family protein n=1 Tax=Cyclonatronum sp. TaxID=3024185 RepID=UPI0025C45FF7|nr:TIGR02757 family protein [Cyclonatronum sp.]MCH8486004.1 TIGR02757 family protein [Cyclonatronum sp.]